MSSTFTKKFDGDVLLSSTGERQLAFELTAQPCDFQSPTVQKVFCSPLRRALLTALAAYPTHRILVEPRLQEIRSSSGLTLRKLRAWLKKEYPDRVKDVDFSKMPTGKWWGNETQEDAEDRLQSLLLDVRRKQAKFGLIALVGHSVAFQTMAGFPGSPFPKLWGTRRGWPKNFKPYFAKVKRSADTGKLRLFAVSLKSAEFVLVRHAHSAKQAARTAERKRLKKSMKQSMKAMKFKR